MKAINDHKADTMMFYCDVCGNDVLIDVYTVFKAQNNSHCPICGAGPDYLELIEREDMNNEN